MRAPQVINLNFDVCMAFPGDSILRDTDQALIGVNILAPLVGGVQTITVNVVLKDLCLPSSTTATTLSGLAMSYRHNVDFWTIELADIIAAAPANFIVNRHKYVGYVSDDGTTPVIPMRSFHISEFTIDNDAIEDVMVWLPYQIEIGSPKSYIRWYYTTPFPAPGPTTVAYQAEVYEGGVGLTAATDPSKITHRGPIGPYSA